MYRAFLKGQELGLFDYKPQKVIYCDETSNGFELACFNSNEWQKLQEKLGIILTDDKNQNFNAIFNSKFCIENSIKFVDDLVNELGFGVLKKFGYEEIEFAYDMQEKYCFYIHGEDKTAGKADFLDWDMNCEGIYLSNGYIDKWILCDDYDVLKITDVSSSELAKFNTKKIDEEIEEFSFCIKIQGYDIVSVKNLSVDEEEVKLLVWTDSNHQNDFREFKLQDIKNEWLLKSEQSNN